MVSVPVRLGRIVGVDCTSGNMLCNNTDYQLGIAGMLGGIGNPTPTYNFKTTGPSTKIIENNDIICNNLYSFFKDYSIVNADPYTFVPFDYDETTNNYETSPDTNSPLLKITKIGAVNVGTIPDIVTYTLMEVRDGYNGDIRRLRQSGSDEDIREHFIQLNAPYVFRFAIPTLISDTHRSCPP